MSSGWGNSICWMYPEKFNCEWTDKSRFDVYGFKRQKPIVGDTLKAEFEKSWCVFEFVSIDYKSDPPDMFFAKVKLSKQTQK